MASTPRHSGEGSPTKDDRSDGQDNAELEKAESINNSTSDNDRTPSDKERRTSSAAPNFTPDGRRVITEDDCYDKLGFSWPTWKKWMILSTIFAVQCSMNYNASVYANGLPLLEEKFGVSEPVARLGQMIFLVAYAFGCELWAPPSTSLSVELRMSS